MWGEGQSPRRLLGKVFECLIKTLDMVSITVDVFMSQCEVWVYSHLLPTQRRFNFTMNLIPRVAEKRDIKSWFLNIFEHWLYSAWGPSCLYMKGNTVYPDGSSRFESGYYVTCSQKHANYCRRAFQAPKTGEREWPVVCMAAREAGWEAGNAKVWQWSGQ